MTVSPWLWLADTSLIDFLAAEDPLDSVRLHEPPFTFCFLDPIDCTEAGCELWPSDLQALAHLLLLLESPPATDGGFEVLIIGGGEVSILSLLGDGECLVLLFFGEEVIF